ncbi:ankyrin repeat domain-containing protein [Aeromicrobium sp. Root344]|uniref:ankyrin repeat domain-containing protein n=1 Tax=Aeromicrobium sp. Root344 TaxID=1736521 RepID=UPI001F1ACEF3|nr:ankyrin repeat domain-containing protein [Aeromicrobium sp. Root344]
MKKVLSVVPVVVALTVTACSSPDRVPEPSSTPSTATPTVTATPNPYASLSGAELGTRLLAASAKGRVAEVSQLLAAGADPEVRDARRRTPLLLAVTHDRVRVARALVTAGADPDALDDRHDTPWLVAGVTGSVAMAKVILTAEPDLTIRNRFGGLSHIPASERGHADYVAYVLDHTDIEVDHVNDLGWTALLEAVILGKGTRPWQRIVESLVDHGSDVSIADRAGVTPLEHARRHGFVTIARILERA